jgi:purine catabolism regulator
VIGPRSTGVIVLCATGHAEEGRRKAAVMRLAERIVKRVATLAPEVSVTVGVGRDTARVEDLPESFRQAELAAHLGGSLWGGNRATHHADLGVYRVLHTLREHGEMIAPPLQRLIDHDHAHHTEYVRTLAAYLACMGRLRAAATRLDIHRNTLEYRMQRIGEIAGVQVDDPNNRLALELGIRLLELRTATESG